MTTIARWLRRLADWCDPPGVPSSLAVAASAAVLEAEQRWPDQGYGEAKRAHVYAHLMRTFPSEPKRRIAFAIEQALQ